MLSIVYSLLADALQNKIVGLVDKKMVNEAMGFLSKRLAVV